MCGKRCQVINRLVSPKSQTLVPREIRKTQSWRIHRQKRKSKSYERWKRDPDFFWYVLFFMFATWGRRRLGRGNRQTNLQPTRGNATDERISTDLDYLNSVMGCPTCEPFLTYTISTYCLHMNLSVLIVSEEVHETLSKVSKNDVITK